jgi:hypothetical protein
LKFQAGLLTFERSLEFIENAIKSFKPDPGFGSAFLPRVHFKSLLICERQKHCLANAKKMVSNDTCIQKDILDLLPDDIKKRLKVIEQENDQTFDLWKKEIDAADLLQSFSCKKHDEGLYVFT